MHLIISFHEGHLDCDIIDPISAMVQSLLLFWIFSFPKGQDKLDHLRNITT